MKRLRILAVFCCVLTLPVQAATVEKSGNMVTIRPDGGQAKVIRLEIMNDHIIRVRATSKDALPLKPKSLMIVPQTAPAKNSFSIEETGESVYVTAENIRAVVDKKSGHIAYFDGQGLALDEGLR